MKALQWFLTLTIFFQISCNPSVPKIAETPVVNAIPELGIGQMEMIMKAQDLAHDLPLGALGFDMYQYYRDSNQMGIKVPLSWRTNLCLYAFRSLKKPSTLRLYIAQVYPQLPYRDSAFYGEIRWLNLQDYTLYWAKYANGEGIAGYPFGRLDFLQKQYDSYHEGRPPIPPHYPFNDTTIERCEECNETGTYRIETEKGFRKCLFSIKEEKKQAGFYVYVFPNGVSSTFIPEAAPSGALWKTPLTWEWQVLEDDMGMNATRFLSTGGRTFYPPLAAF